MDQVQGGAEGREKSVCASRSTSADLPFSNVTILKPRICWTRLPQLEATLADKDQVPTASQSSDSERDSCYKAKGKERRRVGEGYVAQHQLI